jgi:hypothetical protein
VPFTLRPEEGFDVDVESTKYLSGHVDTGDRWATPCRAYTFVAN